MKRFFLLNILLGCLLGMNVTGTSASPHDGQRKQLFNDGWRFALGDVTEASAPGYDDNAWRKLNLPHDWSVEADFDEQAPAGNDGGYLPTGIGWYRKTFTLPASMQGQQVSLYFEGVYMNSEVFVNGKSVGKRPYGYSSFCYDITPYINIGKENVVAVRVDNSQQKNCRWYTGSGIYRHVWLMSHAPVHFAHWGTFITTPEVSNEEALVKLDIALKNETEAPHTVNVCVALEKDGSRAGTGNMEVTLPAGESRTVSLPIKVSQPQCWSPDAPELYQAKLTIEENGQVTDAVSETFGIRTFRYSAEEGFVLNGKPLLLNGGCVHHDNGILGAKSFDAAEAWKVSQLKRAGFNAVRTSHNVPSEAFLRECDRQGLLVIDEAFDGWRDAKTPHDYSTLFDEWWQQDVEAMVLRDRNHPSIFCWSIGNEVIERKKLEVVTTARKLAEHIRRFDATRPVTSALASWDADWEIYDPLAAQHDIVGYNYMIHKSESDHQRVPSRVMMQTESYPRDAFSNWVKVHDNPYIIGDFVWTALDYLGESGIGRYYYKGESEGEHYHRNQYPWHGAYCGDIDLTGWRKPISHYRELLYGEEKKLYLAVREPNGYVGEIKETQWSVYPTWESWDWQGHEGKSIDVEVYSNYARVQLFLNDHPMGELPTTREQQFKAVYSLPYTPGMLKAVALDEDGKAQETVILQSSGEPASIRLTTNVSRLQADGQDLAYIVAEVLDKDGNVVSHAENELQFSVKGAGNIEATGSANLKDGTSYVSPKRKVWKGRALCILRSNGKKGSVTLKVSSAGLKGASVTLPTRD